MCAQPRIALSGVRSSCETIARNSSFIRLARLRLPARRLRVGQLAALLLGALALGDVELGAEHPDRTPVGVADRRGPRPADRSLRAVGPDDAMLHFEKPPVGQRVARPLPPAGSRSSGWTIARKLSYVTSKRPGSTP